jgi:hypothetical protein
MQTLTPAQRFIGRAPIVRGRVLASILSRICPAAEAPAAADWSR